MKRWLVALAVLAAGCSNDGNAPDNPTNSGNVVWIDADELGVVPCLRTGSIDAVTMSCDWAHARRVTK